MKNFILLTRQDKTRQDKTRQDKTRQDNEISLNFSNNFLSYILYYFQSIFSLHNLFNNIVFNNISIISTINQSILKELETLVFERSMAYSNSTNIDFILRELETLIYESKHFLRMFIIKLILRRVHYEQKNLINHF